MRNQKASTRCLDVLEGLLEDAAVLAFKLFSQQDEWEAAWISKRPGIVVFPKLVMVGFDEETGNRLFGCVARAVVVE